MYTTGGKICLRLKIGRNLKNIMNAVVLEKIVEMFIIMMGGVIACKTGLIDENTTKKMSNLLLMLVSPLLIFQSYQMDFNIEFFYGLLWTLLASIIAFIIMIVLANIIYKGDDHRLSVEKMSTIYSNCSFIGIPLVDGILGAEGVLYLTAYVTVFNILVWTNGVWIMGGGSDLKSAWKNLVSPAILSVFIGVFCFVMRIHLPEIVSEPVQMIADMNTPLAMIVAGSNLARTNILKSLKNIRLYSVSFVRLLLFPLISVAVLYLMHLEFYISFTVFIATACPAGATTIMFAEKYGRDARYASEIFTVTTVLSAVTIPLLSMMSVSLLG